jgi:hypothetical protein
MNAYDPTSSSCPKPRRATETRGATILLAFGLSFAFAGCDGIIFPPPEGCANLTELCPDLVCPTGHQTADDGCLICQCNPEEEPVPTVCWEDSECGAGQRCDSVNFCESPPGCSDDLACPAVCYGRCVAAPTSCNSDADCGAGQACRYGEPVNAPEARPSDQAEPAPCSPDNANCDPIPPPNGVCVPVECAGDRMAYPACPPGTQPVIDFSNDPCGNVQCIPVDDCRALSPEQCEQVPGCHVEEYGSGGCGDCGSNQDCLCMPEVVRICVPDETDCYGLDEESCSQNPACYPSYYTSGCAAPAPDCNGDTDCGWGCDPAYGFVCLPRDPGQTCFSDFDCAPGERCSYETECYDVCYAGPNGESYCYSECYGNTGICIPDASSCYDLPLEQCEQDPRCMIETFGGFAPCFCDPNSGECNCDGEVGQACVPRPTPTCYSDSDCGYGQRCELEAYCPPCDDGLWSCDMPCHVSGVCVDDGPLTCDELFTCPPGYTCEAVYMCSDCGYAGDDENGPQMPPYDCSSECYEDIICVPAQNDYCYSDQDCGAGTQCNIDLCLNDPNCPNCDVCVGICEPIPGDLCFIDSDCGTGICNTWDYCEIPGGSPPNGLIACLGRCEELPTPPSACLENADCAQGERCATELDICYCPNDVCTMEAPCYSMCVPFDPTTTHCYIDEDCGPGGTCWDGMCVYEGGGPDCIQVITPAVGPNGQCHEFPTPCDVPADHQVVESCQP